MEEGLKESSRLIPLFVTKRTLLKRSLCTEYIMHYNVDRKAEKRTCHLRNIFALLAFILNSLPNQKKLKFMALKHFVVLKKKLEATFDLRVQTSWIIDLNFCLGHITNSMYG